MPSKIFLFTAFNSWIGSPGQRRQSQIGSQVVDLNMVPSLGYTCNHTYH